MKTINKIKLASVICVFCLITYALPQNCSAQRFSHGGGGGGGFRGGGGGGGGRSINGGSRNTGNHVFRSPVVARPERPAGPIGRNEGIYHHVSGYHPYAYHPYHPYMWGAYWHPFGFFAYGLTANAIMFSIASQQYYYDNGVYYQPSGSGYTVVPPPIGAVVSYLPAGYITIMVGDATYYYYGGAFYISQGGSFVVVPAPLGAIVTEIPEGATEQVINGENYLLYNNTYYQPISQDGQDAYEVVQVN